MCPGPRLTAGGPGPGAQVSADRWGQASPVHRGLALPSFHFFFTLFGSSTDSETPTPAREGPQSTACGASATTPSQTHRKSRSASALRVPRPVVALTH